MAMRRSRRDKPEKEATQPETSEADLLTLESVLEELRDMTSGGYHPGRIAGVAELRKRLEAQLEK